MNYRIKNIKGNPKFILEGIILNNTGETCIYWKNKSAQKIDEAIVVLKNNNIRNIKDNQVCISLNGINDINSQKECLKAFCDQLRIMGTDKKEVTFIFVISDRREGLLIKDINDSLGLNSKVLINNPNKEKTLNTSNEIKNQEIEQKTINNNELKEKSKIVDIPKYDSARVNNEINNKTQEAFNISQKNVTMKELKKERLNELLKDPIKGDMIRSMNQNDVDKYLTELVTKDLKSLNTREDTSDTALSITNNNDSNKNTDTNNYEKDDGKTIKSTRLDMSTSSFPNINNSTDSIPVQMKKEEQKVRPDTMIFTPQIPKDNAASNSKHKANAKKIKLQKDNNVEKGAISINAPVIIFVISIILLITSGIIWFITK